MLDFLLIAAGFALLIFGANYLVDGAVGIARRFNVPNLVIGLTIVAFGTSAPELVVNLFAAFDPATTDIALTNIIGSNTINIFIILGVAALVFPIKSQASSRKFDIPLSIAAPLVVLLMAVFDSAVSRTDGVILLIIFAFFMYRTVRQASKTRNAPEPAEESTGKPKRMWLAVMLVVGGLLMLVAGGQLIVRSATKIAEALGISQSIIGLTIVALGTSLPELATSVVAAMKKNSDIALGNVIGSNIFNVFFILGISATIRPLPAYGGMIFDLLLAALGCLLVFVFVIAGKKHEIKRWEGLLLLIIYAVYLTWMINTAGK